MAVDTPLSTSGRFIVDAHGKRIRLAGVNWYGASEDLGVPAGLDSTGLGALARLIAEQGFNCVRLPFSLWMLDQTAPVPQQYLKANPDLHGSTPIEVYDACVKALTERDLIVIPNCHQLDFGWCCKDDDGNGLWFNDRWPAEKFIAAWQHITRRYASNPLVAAMDIKNEPRPAKVGGQVLEPTWGTGDRTDFAAMYTTIGNLIHQINPHPLIICEGLNYACNLTGVASHRVRLREANKVVYSMHDYSWCGHKGQDQAAYNTQMNKNGGYLLADKTAPVWLGEFGHAAATLPPKATEWWNYIMAWLKELDVDWCWWALNPTHGRSSAPGTNQVLNRQGAAEPYGLLTQDWSGVRYPAVVTMLKAVISPRTGPGVG